MSWLNDPVPPAGASRHCVEIANADTGERWIFLFDAESLPALYGCLGRYAADPELNFSWYDAAVCSQSARRLLAEQRPRD